MSTESQAKVKVYISSISMNKEVKQLQQRVLQVLEARKIPHEVRDIATDKAAKRDFRLYMRTDKASPPQIFNADQHCGDYEAFYWAVEDEKLEEFLKLKAPDSKPKAKKDEKDATPAAEPEAQAAAAPEASSTNAPSTEASRSAAAAAAAAEDSESSAEGESSPSDEEPQKDEGDAISHTAELSKAKAPPAPVPPPPPPPPPPPASAPPRPPPVAASKARK